MSDGAVVKKGHEGPDVTALQGALTAAGYFVGAVDGIFGPRTEAAGETQETTSRQVLAEYGAVGLLPIPDTIRHHHGEEVHVHVRAYSLDGTLLDENAGSFFVTSR